jgi:heat shock protein HslJ
MKNVRFGIVCLVIISALGGVACSQSSASPTAPSSASASGAVAVAPDVAGAWTLVSIQPSGEAVQVKPATADYSAIFENGRISLRADCNVCSGLATVSSGAVSIGPVLACTRAACPTMEFASVYVSLLAGEHSAATDGRSLTLQSAGGIVRFQR